MGKPATSECEDLLYVAELLRNCKRGVALTGAGISTPSGIPDFRSEGSGLWTRYDPMEVASLSAFRHHPEKVFAWMRPLAIQIFQASPNPAHNALAQLEQAGFLHTVVTQNIDGLHHRAGSRNVLEVHGTLRTLTCVGCYRQVDSAGFIEPYLERGEIPHCPECGSILKPDAVLFEEQLPFRTWQLAEAACRECDLMMVAGSSLEIIPVASLPLLAVENDAALIMINHSPTYMDVRASAVLRGDVAEVIPRIAAEALNG